MYHTSCCIQWATPWKSFPFGRFSLVISRTLLQVWSHTCNVEGELRMAVAAGDD